MSYVEKADSSRRAREKRRESLSAAFLSNIQALRRYLARFLGDRHDIDDLVQDVYLRVVERGGDTQVDHPRAFLYKVARNAALNEKDKAHLRLTEPLDNSKLESAPITLSLDDQAEQAQRFEHFCEAVNQLPVQCRRVFVMKKIDGLANADIARRLGISVSTVDKHLAKGMIQCKEALKQQGHLDHLKAGANRPTQPATPSVRGSVQPAEN